MEVARESARCARVYLAFQSYCRLCRTGVSRASTTLPQRSQPIWSLGDRLQDRHTIGGLQSQLKVHFWERELSKETDLQLREFLWAGVTKGFNIVDDVEIHPYHCRNYKSALTGDAFCYVDQLISDELADGKFLVAQSKPRCVHAIGAISKADNTYRPITDCKRPLSVSINNYMKTTCDTFKYMTVDNICDSMYSNVWMATIDIHSAYRGVSINPDHWGYQGVEWSFNGEPCLLYDTRLSFGLRCAPYVFTRISEFISRCMRRRGYHIIHYIDDYLVFGPSFADCQRAQMELITLLGNLGFSISWKKCSSPSRQVKYLGLIFDSVAMTISLPSDKMLKLHKELLFFENRRRATRRQLQRLTGILGHCARVVRGGRTFSRRIIDLLKGLPDGNPRVYLNEQFRCDLDWWRRYADFFNGTACVIKYNYGEGVTLQTDSSASGYGVVCGDTWLAGYFNSDLRPVGVDQLVPHHQHWLNMNVPADAHISALELIPVVVAARRLAPLWQNQHVVCFSDNSQVVAMLNRGVSTNALSMQLLRELFWLSATNNFHITGRHIPGVDNIVPDMLSRVHTSNDLYAMNTFSLCCRPFSTNTGCGGRLHNS